MKSWLSIVVVSLAFSLQARGPGGGCGGREGKGGGGCGGGKTAGPVNGGACAVALQAGQEEAVVLKMPRDAWVRLWTDEIAARDLYAALDEQTRRPVFQNIGRAEVHHRDTIASLLTAAGYELPQEPAPGAYEAEEIRQVYADLLQQGQQSELDAFKAGAAFEELDITELERELAREALSDVERQVLTALRDASVRHLRAFRRQITRMGGTPELTHLPPERLEALLN